MSQNQKVDPKEDANLQRTKIAVGAIIEYQGKILLCRSPKWSKKWVIPGGGLHWGETIEETAKREVKEETGLDVEVKKIGDVRAVVNPPEFKNSNSIQFILIDCITQAKSDKVILDKKEHDRCKWVTPEEALKLDLLPFTRTPLERYIKEQEQKDYLEGWQRCKADFLNYQNQTENRLAEAVAQAKENTILEFLPVLDNFELAMAHVPTMEKEASWVQGISYIKKQLEDILEKEGISTISAEGQNFDPRLHDCLEEVPCNPKEDGKVLTVSQKGYLRRDKVMRPAKVKVGRTQPTKKSKNGPNV